MRTMITLIKYIGKISITYGVFISLCIANENVTSTSLEGNLVKSEHVNAKEVKSNVSKVASDIQILLVNPLISILLDTKEGILVDEVDIDNTLAKITLTKEPLNNAEQYLILVIEALLEEKVNHSSEKSKRIIQILEPANELSDRISEEQLSQPEFLKLHLLLAKHYAMDEQFDKAYLEKKAYLNKYYLYRKTKRLAMIESLEQSFDVKNKKANNAFLESQNVLKIRHVAEVKEKKDSQQYNFTLIISTAIVFVLLFFRQLRIRNKLIKLTRTDALTGLANRSALFEYGEKMVASFVDTPSELSVLLLDLDHFKKINDNFGHQVGDKVLIVVSQLVTETMRSRDVFSRLGGEEFVALLPYADCNKAKAIAMRINDKIAKYDFSSLMVQSKVTISIGVATMEHNQMSFDDVLHSADLAMYQAKEQGRNTVVCYQDIAKTQDRRIASNTI